MMFETAKMVCQWHLEVMRRRWSFGDLESHPHVTSSVKWGNGDLGSFGLVQVPIKAPERSTN